MTEMEKKPPKIYWEKLMVRWFRWFMKSFDSPKMDLSSVLDVLILWRELHSSIPLLLHHSSPPPWLDFMRFFGQMKPLLCAVWNIIEESRQCQWPLAKEAKQKVMYKLAWWIHKWMRKRMPINFEWSLFAFSLSFFDSDDISMCML